ncbi:unnamed protein product [Brachionus calyciflorus]|uniref:CW-type domain-containing protein n=1 Tax=Brachionus calyciflorus TaxID=104777 RepID=A0A813Z017_9BILA|nr:unnamed protein product [Brachionus calyciflorus]
MSKKYVNLSRANLNSDYLESNSTTHDFAFGALAELVDNSRDAESNNLKIYTIPSEFRGGNILCFLDDGTGMSPNEAADIIKFGKSAKRTSDKNYIGQYGNGLKSGSMRIGKDLLIFTKKDNVGTILFISETFLKNENIDEIVVPLPSFDCKTKRPIFDPDLDEVSSTERLETELNVLYRYTPFKKLDTLLKQFDQIGTHGTLALIYNLKLKDGSTELDFESDPHDIWLRGLEVEFDRKSQIEHRSFRAYLTILYSDPRMKIYIQGKKVLTKLLERNLLMPRVMTYTSTKFKNRALEEKKEAEAQLSKAQNELREAQSVYQDNQNRFSNNKSAQYYINNAKLVKEMEIAKENVEKKRKLLEKRSKEVNEQKELQFIFGINIHNRDADGLFIYNSSRLITMFEHTRNQKKNADYRGLVGIVNVPYIVSRPTHNKQTFTDTNEQKDLIKALSDYMDCYYNELKDNELSREFWSSLGYLTSHPGLPSDEEPFKRKRIQKSKICLQCDVCLKWRILRYNPVLLTENYYKDNWTCADNTDTSAQNCDVPEKLEDFVKMDYRKIKETNFAEIEKTTCVIPPLRPMPSQKGSSATLVEKDNNETVTRSVPPTLMHKSISEPRQCSRINGPRSSLTESDSDTSINGRRTNDASKKKRLRDSDDENDPEFRLYEYRNKNKSKSQTKTNSTNYNVPTAKKTTSNMLQNNQLYDSEERNVQLETDTVENGVTIKNEPQSIDNFVMDTTSMNGDRILVQADEHRKLETVSNKYREMLLTFARFSGQMHDIANDLPSYNLEELCEFSNQVFFEKFKKSQRKNAAEKKDKNLKELASLMKSQSIPEESIKEILKKFSQSL